jgi:2-keto-4-pentenoate hydratase
MSEASTELGRALIEAHQTRRLVNFAPRLVPASVAEAMRVQKEVIDAVGASVAGWKVGYTPDGIPVAGPIYAGVMHAGGAVLRHGPLGKSGIEVEIALLLGQDLPPRPGKPYRRDEVLAATRALIAGIEIVAPRFPDPPKPPFLAILADNIGNGAYLRGAEISDFRGLDLAHLRARLTIDGRTVHDAIGGHAKGDPLAPVVDYANRPCDLLGGLRAGQVVTTGTLSGCPYVDGAAKVTAEIGGLGEVRLEIAG